MAQGRKTGGRQKGTPNRATAELRLHAQQYDTEAIDLLMNLARNEGIEDRARVLAATRVLEFGHGKPPQAITGPDGGAVVPPAVTIVIRKATGAENRD